MLSKALTTAAAGSAGGDYQISRSLRFNSADSAYLSRTPASAGNRKTWTWSGWVKRSTLGTTSGTQQFLFGAGTDNNNRLVIELEFGNSISVFATQGGVSPLVITTTQVFRDISAWYHIVFALDTTQATDSNRAKLYINGVQVTALATATYPSLDDTFEVNTTNGHVIGARGTYSVTNLFNGYLADIHFVDGQQLTPSSFGEVDAVTGVWKPIKFNGPWNVGTGVNGFYLPFSDNSNTTATTLGKDDSGNGNNWTPSGSPGFSVASGAGNDSLVDSPTQYGTDTGAGGEVRGNYATLNPLDQVGANTYSNGNLDVVVAAGTNVVSGSIAVSSGKWYWEVFVNSNYASMIGVADANFSASNRSWATANGWALYDNGSIYNSGSSTAYGVGYTTNDLISIALDMDNGKVYWAKNGTWLNSGNPVTQTNPGVTGLTGKKITSLFSNGGGGGTNNLTANFGQRPFAYTAPSGFKALCTTNLPDPTVVQGDDYFNTVLWTGDGNSSRSFTGWGFAPDFIWIKSRSNARDHALIDKVRGTGAKVLESNLTDAENSYGLSVTSFDSDGFTGATGSINFTYANALSDTYVGWGWKANGAGVSNTDGTITSTVSANTTAGISIVTATAQSSGVATFGHGLGVAPSMVIIKGRASTSSWGVYHISTGNDGYLLLNSTSAYTADGNFMNSTSPSSTVFTLGASYGGYGTFVAYCFAEVEGFSKFGSYTGNGSTDGPFVYLGFRPRYLLVKNASAVYFWLVEDTVRTTSNVMGAYLFPNQPDAEGTNAYADFLSNGFKIRDNGASYNGSGNTIIYMAFASNPFKTSLAR